MGAVASSVAKSVLGHSDAENAFRPWWDNVQDHLIYGLITTGKFYITVHWVIEPNEICIVRIGPNSIGS